MNILLVLIPVTLLVIGIAVALFFWAVNHQQFDDLDSPGVLPLMDAADDHPPADRSHVAHENATERCPPERVSQSPDPTLSSAATTPVPVDAVHDRPA